MKSRPLTADDVPAWTRLKAEAFAGGSRPGPTEEPPRTPSGLNLGIFDGARLVACATTLSLQMQWGESTLPLGGVAAVACAADQRGRGHVARLLRESLIAMREDGLYLSGLYPFAFAFYRRHGWDWVGERRQIALPTREIPSFPEGRSLRCYDGPDALETVRPLYERWIRSYRGALTRSWTDPDFWAGALEHRAGRTAYVHVYEDPHTGAPEGYLIFRYPTTSEPPQVTEFCALTPAATRGLLSVLHYYGTQVQAVQVDAPSDETLTLFVMHHEVKTMVRPLFMGRIVDVVPALSAVSVDPGLSGRCVIQVDDPVCEWNRGSFELVVEEGRVSARHTPLEPGISLDIQTLTQAYWGQPDLGRLRAAGRVGVFDEAAYRLLNRLLAPARCFLIDFF